MSIDACPVVYPTEAEFRDFHAYAEHLDRTYSSRFGMVKVSFYLPRLYHPLDGSLGRLRGMMTSTL